MDHLINETKVPMEFLLSNAMIDKDQMASLVSSCSKLVTQYKFDLLSLYLQVTQSIRRGYQQLLSELMNKFSSCDWNETLKEAIIARQNKMVERQDLSLEHRLNTFFRRYSDGVRSKKQHDHYRSKVFLDKTITASS